MNTSVLEDIILNIILIIFPILVFLVYTCSKSEINNKNTNLYLNIALITSLYLCLRFGVKNDNSKILLFCNIPIVIAYMKNKSYFGIILSIINIVYCYFIYKQIYATVLIKYICYLVLYLCARKRKLSKESFILSVGVIQGFFLSFEYFFRSQDITLNSFIEVIVLVFIYYFLTFAILYVFKVIERVQSLNNSIKIMEKDKVIKNSLFKLTHEIKNPLAVIKGYLDMINLDNKEKALKYINIMKEETKRSLNIISDFLEFNKIKIEKQEIDINMLLDSVYNSAKILMQDKKIDLIYKENDEEIYINADYERLKQVIINLLKNSSEAINNNGKIEIKSKIYNNSIEIMVCDNGIGMDEESLSNLKEMFYTTKKNGSGLGVALSNEIIEAHSGELIYDSKLNEGTTATIRLPR